MAASNLQPFRSAVWNLYGGTPIERSRPALKETIDWGCTLWICCEARGGDRNRLFRSEGLETVAHDQVRIAWDPDRWSFDGQEWGGKISEQHYYRKDGKTPVWSLGQFATLTDLASGDLKLKLEVGSYHTPAGVQSPASDRPKRRYQSFIESLLFLAARAQETKADGFLSGGDDNWDEDGRNNKGDGVQTPDTEPIMLGQATGLRQLQAGKPTFGRREIDDYRILRLSKGGHVSPTGKISVIDGRGAEPIRHKIHMREWRWHNIQEPAPEKTIEQLANEVLDGLWGNGEERRERLTKAGYNYDRVQAKVRELLNPPAPEPTRHPCPACGAVHLGVIPTSSG